MSLSSEEIIESIDKIDASSFKDDNERARAEKAAARLLARLETPFRTTWRRVWEEPAVTAATKTCGDLQLFEKWIESGGKPKTAKELADMTGCDVNLLSVLAPPGQ